MRQQVTIQGATVTTDGAVNQFDAGVLALPSNAGTYTQSEFVIVPEIGFTLFCQLTPHSRVTFGYSLLVLPDVVRPGDAIDLQLDPRQIPPQSLPGADDPGFVFREDDFWARGLSWGFELSY
jgi:hypothetical protein